MCNVYEEACFSQKMFTNELNMGLPLQAWVEKTVHGVDIHWLSSKKKIKIKKKIKKEVPDTGISKRHADNHLGYERTHQYWFPWKGSTVKCFLLPTSLAKFTLFIEWPS